MGAFALSPPESSRQSNPCPRQHRNHGSLHDLSDSVSLRLSDRLVEVVVVLQTWKTTRYSLREKRDELQCGRTHGRQGTHLLVALDWVRVLNAVTGEECGSPLWSTGRLFLLRRRKYPSKPEIRVRALTAFITRRQRQREATVSTELHSWDERHDVCFEMTEN